MKTKTLFFIIFFSFFLAFISASTVPTYNILTNFTFRYWIPFQGIVVKENEYKKAFYEAEQARTDSNSFLLDLLRSQNLDEAFSITNSIKDRFTQREESYKKMLLIDEETNKALFLPSDYRHFYNLRKQADLQDQNAFLQYKNNMQLYLEGMIELFKYDLLFTKAGTYHKLVVANSFKKEDIDNFNTIVQETIEQQKEVEAYAQKGVYPDTLQNLLQQRYIFLNRIIALHAAMSKGELEEGLKLFKEAEKNSEGIFDPVTITEDWLKKVEEVNIAQEENHEMAFHLYKTAYTYAKTKNLTLITDQWNNSAPGLIEE